MISRKVAHELHMRPRVRNKLGYRGIGESGFDPVELWVKSRKGDDVLHDNVSKACQSIACRRVAC